MYPWLLTLDLLSPWLLFLASSCRWGSQQMVLNHLSLSLTRASGTPLYLEFLMDGFRGLCVSVYHGIYYLKWKVDVMVILHHVWACVNVKVFMCEKAWGDSVLSWIFETFSEFNTQFCYLLDIAICYLMLWPLLAAWASELTSAGALTHIYLFTCKTNCTELLSTDLFYELHCTVQTLDSFILCAEIYCNWRTFHIQSTSCQPGVIYRLFLVADLESNSFDSDLLVINVLGLWFLPRFKKNKPIIDPRMCFMGTCGSPTFRTSESFALC